MNGYIVYMSSGDICEDVQYICALQLEKEQ